MAKFSLTDQQTKDFARGGMLRLPSYFSTKTMTPIAVAIWKDLDKRFGIKSEKRESWSKERPAQFQGLVRSGAFDALGEGLSALADAFLGEGTWMRPRHFCQPLVTFPSAHWDVPHSVWHVDLPPSDPETPLPCVRTFVLLEAVEAKGGGTGYVEGSHRVIADLARQAPEELRSTDVKHLLGNEPWFAALLSQGEEDRERRFMTEGSVVRDVSVHFKETIGDQGDVYVMHPAMLHTITPNIRERPRMMLGQSFYRGSTRSD